MIPFHWPFLRGIFEDFIQLSFAGAAAHFPPPGPPPTRSGSEPAWANALSFPSHLRVIKPTRNDTLAAPEIECLAPMLIAAQARDPRRKIAMACFLKICDWFLPVSCGLAIRSLFIPKFWQGPWTNRLGIGGATLALLRMVENRHGCNHLRDTTTNVPALPNGTLAGWPVIRLFHIGQPDTWDVACLLHLCQ